jgi:serine/threonine protein kinase/tetratricopeptide (TPR) repeat protein
VTEPAVEPQTIGRYRITRTLGEGGMGVVYAAHDPRLDRSVAIKRIRGASADATLRERLLREARTAAGLSHPNVCQVYELSEDQDGLYLVMELLTGEALADRIARGPLTLASALEITLGILSALEALHTRGVVHRDLKPSNVFLTPHGVKLLDFGLARPLVEQLRADPGLTMPGTIMGTPRYMPPEQWDGEAIVAASDLFAVGAILFEMLAGKPAFTGETVIELYRSIALGEPPALAGGPEVIAADRIIQRALAKAATDRYADSGAMAKDVRGAMTRLGTEPATPARAMTRLVVLPFRSLRPDEETDFLSFSLPDAITASLSGLRNLVVRSTAAGQRFATDVPDLEAIAAGMGVDVVVTGTLLRAGEQVRVATQMLEAPGGAVVCSHRAQVRLTDIFQLQDDLAHQIVESLAIPLSSREQHLLGQNLPASARAYDLYLRANHLSANTSKVSRLTVARELYEACLREDPRYAPAWARLGRIHRVLGKYGIEAQERSIALAGDAFRKALELNPDLPLAHNFYTYYEIEEQGRAPEAMVRLLERVSTAAADPNLFAGLVVACRFCGLLEASIAADRRARRIDPAIQTSVHFTYWALGDWEQAAIYDVEDMQMIRNGSLWMQGRHEEALQAVRDVLANSPETLERSIIEGQLAYMEGRKDDVVRYGRAQLDAGFHDPEGLLIYARELAYLGESDAAMVQLERAVKGGFHCPPSLTHDPWLDSLRTRADFVRLVREAETGHARAAELYLGAGGERILGAGTG